MKTFACKFSAVVFPGKCFASSQLETDPGAYLVVLTQHRTLEQGRAGEGGGMAFHLLLSNVWVEPVGWSLFMPLPSSIN